MTSFLRVFRLIFVIFSLYLLGDAFYRWDGFRYYASFAEFLPNVSLAYLFWSILAVCAAFFIWLSLRVFGWVCRLMRLIIRIEHLLLFVCIVALLFALGWSGKTLRLPYLAILFPGKPAAFILLTVAAIFIAWLFRNKAERWESVIHERITPLVWIFGIFVIFSVPLVAYQTLSGKKYNSVSQEVVHSSGSGNNRPNIVLVTFDAMTARDMSLYGYKKPTTPFMSEWAKNASVFARAKSDSNITTPATASLMTGKRLWTHQTYHLAGWYDPVDRSSENLPLLLKKSGYYTMAFVVNPYASVDKLGIRGSFDVAPIETGFSMPANVFESVDILLYQWFGNRIKLYDWIIKRDFILFKLLSRISSDVTFTTAPPEKAFRRFLSVIDDNQREPFFAWIHLYPPHDPYLPPEPYIGMFSPSQELRTYKSQEQLVRSTLEYESDGHFPKNIQQYVDVLRARYDGFVRYCDKQFEDFIGLLQKRDKFKNTVIILSADHGESFEHGYLKHSFPHLYEQVTHIPLIIKEPGMTEGRVIDDLVEQIDIPATILDLAGIAVPSWVEGRSLVPLMRGEKPEPGIIFSMSMESQMSRNNQITSGTIAVWEDYYKLIYYIDNNKSLLFNLEQDPDESINLFDSEPGVGEKLLALIKDNLAKANEKIITGRFNKL
jgi:arylsulfatase A-like enzyme